jgi:hypothetical protein
LYTSEGWFTFGFFMVGLLLVAFLARQLSWAVEISRQQSRLMEKLEELGRAVLGITPGEQELSEVLRVYIPQFLPSARIAVWLVDTSQLIVSPQDFVIEVDTCGLGDRRHVLRFFCEYAAPGQMILPGIARYQYTYPGESQGSFYLPRAAQANIRAAEAETLFPSSRRWLLKSLSAPTSLCTMIAWSTTENTRTGICHASNPAFFDDIPIPEDGNTERCSRRGNLWGLFRFHPLPDGRVVFSLRCDG